MFDKEFSLVGVTFEPAMSNLALCADFSKQGNPTLVELKADPDNKYDSNAIRVLFKYGTPDFIEVGWIAKKENQLLHNYGLEKLWARFLTYKYLLRSDGHEDLVGAKIQVTG